MSNSKLVCNISGGMFSPPHPPRNHPKNKLWQFLSDLDATWWGPTQPPFHPHSVVDPSAFQIYSVLLHINDNVKAAFILYSVNSPQRTRDLQFLTLFFRSPNQSSLDSNVNRDVYVPNPSCDLFTKFEFIGRLMGACFR